ncbi:Plasmid stabilization system protein ParE [Pedobacter sp. ok626]|uniref:type II toxin-antitoxin system RelE/ParE family toxin n=1 Tax=Pedobacter sp. ok626 TaxID=1761882 RepID=UPI00087E1C8A|nr:type II toxin-antitoxin system RelE/ParE family toxin [Pedobacter sp. ok626]SDJ34414.1 Plasmid stabilization system protein ParE [Pedobacter sp. ok626]
MSYNIRFLPAAESEYIKAYQWYEEHLEGLGDRFSRSVEKQIKLISKNPENYQIKERNCRESKIDVFPYIVVYKIYPKANDILIVAIFHTSRKPGKKYRR